MNSLIGLNELEKIPLSKQHKRYTYKDIVDELYKIQKDYFVIETAVGIESVLGSFFTQRNIPDDLEEAYNLAFSNVSEQHSLYERYSEMIDRGPESINGFVGSIKGKLFELKLPEQLEAQFPEYSFEIATSPNQPVWDIIGHSNSGESILIQAKMGGANYVDSVLERVQDNPDVLFATSSEIHDAIISSHPELADQLIEVNMSNYDFTENVNHDLELLTDNMGIDVPDGLGDILPYISEIILGVRLIKDLINVQRDFKDVSADDKAKISAVKAIVLFSRFGVSTICTSLGAAGGGMAGSIFPGFGNLIGSVIGGIGGAFGAGKLNKYLVPHYMDFALGLTGLTQDDLFYFRNKTTIDNMAFSYYEYANNINIKFHNP